MKKLSIALDANEANVANRVGTGQYCYQILSHWYKQDLPLEFHLYHRDPLLPHMPPARPNWQYTKVSPKRAWLSFSLPLYLSTHQKQDLFWSPAHYAPAYGAKRSVVTIHDLAYEYFPDMFLKRDLYKLKNWTKRALSHAHAVIAVSEATKDDLVALYGIDPEIIQVVPNGYDSSLFNQKTKADPLVLPKYQLEKERYLLFLGTIQPRKNAIKLIQAFHLLKQDGYKGKLVLAGNIGWMAEETLSAIKSSLYAKDIVLTGYVSDQTRHALYRYAEVYVLPSLYEGFGVPVLEAMGCGTPVVASNNSSIPEVVGEAGLLFNASDPVEIANCIKAVQEDRATWVKKSLARAKHFSWEKCAKETLAVLTSGKIG